ncbi:hypothetical protein ILP92_03540 [Maribius pontilimi]|uniref:Lipoprotein n=1 Tax=Palleronia pontilimi TaxID=1964209 RepID=A0A934MD01_9RHOB|nr:hypothetical protein [Palleronia pontilimi]MBJ3761821.1 hypothetical protein [Palleronia pontilimi]
MKPFLTGALGALALAGCMQQPMPEIDPQEAANATANPPELSAVLAQLEPAEGKPLGEGLTLRDARGEGGRLVLDMALDSDAAIATPQTRAEFIAGFEDSFGQQLCAVPALRAFIQTRGGVTATVAAPDGTPVASRSIDAC